ncbi:thiolase C-terminal domain-containing protein [Eisenibacter elegans]|jgi:acetyl-CoA C-acetyltransferase|uniref:thiolase C-terminal domain-containing protein n=1 Tax=Eisenibacter elegans TaxID=997 RepID=UPI000688A2DE|nr:hypothetical protein [Eisenibacter elegans]
MNNNTPILVAAAQLVQRFTTGEMPQHPLALMEKAARQALDTLPKSISSQIDSLQVVNVFSYTYKDAPRALAEQLALQPSAFVYSEIGGNTPQYLVNQAALALAQGKAKAVLITGAEAMYGYSKAMRSGLKLDWPAKAAPEYINGSQRLGSTELENSYDLYLPTNMYPLFETALEAEPGYDIAKIGALYARFSEVAAQNPYAWTQERYSPEQIVSPSDDNRYIAYPYTKRLTANINTDQAAAVVMTTVGLARQLGIDEAQWVYLRGGAAANDVWEVSARPNLAESPAIAYAAQQALQQAGSRLEDIDAFDLYSCFPSAVQIALKAIGLTIDDPRPLSLTGSLAYFGGPGNNYSLHAIATAVERLQQGTHQQVMVTALGWFVTKHAIGVYGKKPGLQAWENYDPQTDIEAQNQIDASAWMSAQAEYTGEMQVEAYSLLFNRNGQPEKAIVLGRIGEKQRTLAILNAETLDLTTLPTYQLVGKKIQVAYQVEKKRNFVVKC